MLIRSLDPQVLTESLTQRAIERRRPLSCTFELTCRCNFRCPFCYVRMTDAQAAPFGRQHTAEEWLDMARQVRDAGVLYLTLTGGECTLFPGFADFYRELSRMGFLIDLMSNGAAWPPDVREAVSVSPPNRVCISLYGGSNATYAAVTGDPYGFDHTVETLRFLVTNGIPVNASFTVVRRNVMDLPKVTSVLAKLGLSWSLCMDLTPHVRDPSFSDVVNWRLSPAQQVCLPLYPPEEVGVALRRARVLEQELTGFVPPGPDGPLLHEPLLCLSAHTAATIFWNGDMQTCISLAGLPGAKPFETGFETAWQQLQSDRAQVLRQPEACLRCNLARDCPQNCFARHFEGHGRGDTPDPDVCRLAFLRARYREMTGHDRRELCI